MEKKVARMMIEAAYKRLRIKNSGYKDLSLPKNCSPINNVQPGDVDKTEKK